MANLKISAALFPLFLIQNLSALNVSFPPKSLVYTLQNKVQPTTTEKFAVEYTTTQEIDISAVNVTNLTVEDINKIAEGLPPQNSTARKSDVFIVYAESVKEEPKAVPLPEQEAYVVEAQKLMSMVADDLEADASNSYALAARSRGTDRLTPEERKNKLHMLFRVKKNATQEVTKTKRYSYTDNFEPLKVNTNNSDVTTSEPETNNLIEEPTTVANYFTPPQQIPPNTYYANPPAAHFEPPNKQFYGYVRHDLHLIDSGNKPQQPYLSVQQPVYNRNQFGEKNFQAHVQHPPIENFYRPVQNQFANPENAFNQLRGPRPVQNQYQGAPSADNAFNQLGGRQGQTQVYQNFAQQPGYMLSPQQQSFFGRILPMFG